MLTLKLQDRKFPKLISFPPDLPVCWQLLHSLRAQPLLAQRCSGCPESLSLDLSLLPGTEPSPELAAWACCCLFLSSSWSCCSQGWEHLLAIQSSQGKGCHRSGADSDILKAVSEIPKQLRGIFFTFPPYLRHCTGKAPAEKYM